MQKGQFKLCFSLPSHLPAILSELAPCSTFVDRLSRHRRAVPSASLDKSVFLGLFNYKLDNTIAKNESQ